MDATGLDEDMDFCPRCGATMPQGAVVCPFCGYGEPTYQMADPRVHEKRTQRPGIAGALLIMAGVLTLITGALMLLDIDAFVQMMMDALIDFPEYQDEDALRQAVTVCASVEIILAVLAAGGGLMAIRRRGWGFAMLGAVAAILSIGPSLALSSILGIVALFLLITCRGEFS